MVAWSDPARAASVAGNAPAKDARNQDPHYDPGITSSHPTPVTTPHTSVEFTRLPVVRHIRADLDTPLSAYLKLVDGPDAYLLESVEGSETWGR